MNIFTKAQLFVYGKKIYINFMTTGNSTIDTLKIPNKPIFIKPSKILNKLIFIKPSKINYHPTHTENNMIKNDYTPHHDRFHDIKVNIEILSNSNSNIEILSNSNSTSNCEERRRFA